MSSSAGLPSPFGAYVLLHRLGRGGMGEVFLASRGAPAALLGPGLAKLTVVKMLRPDLNDDQEYVTRFIDEARIVVQLNHGNICQVHDVGKNGNTYFLAMEYIAGHDLKELVERAAERGVKIPEPVTLFIIRELLEALDYAHNLADNNGVPLHLVHRDVSPRNVMISLEGDVKLIDFGLAASRLKQSLTEPSFVMGKIAYMPPEQARHEPVDARADLFAAGVLAYELLTGARYYEGISLDEMWRRAGAGDHLPKRLPDMPPDLGLIVRRALAADRAQRWPNADAFRRALETYERDKVRASARDVRALMHSLFADEERKARDLIAELVRIASIVDTPFDDPLMQPTETQVIATRTGSFSSQSAPVPVTDPAQHDATVETPSVFPSSSSSGSSSAPSFDPAARAPTLADTSSVPTLSASMPTPAITDPASPETAKTPIGRVVRSSDLADLPVPTRSKARLIAASVVAIMALVAAFLLGRAHSEDSTTPSPPITPQTFPTPTMTTATTATTTTTTTTPTTTAPGAAVGTADAGVSAKELEARRSAGPTTIATTIASTAAATSGATKKRVSKKPTPPKLDSPGDSRMYVAKYCPTLSCAEEISRINVNAIETSKFSEYMAQVHACAEKCFKAQ